MAINPQIVWENKLFTAATLLSWQYTGKGMSKYSQVYGVRVYSTLCSLQQVVVTYKFTSL